MQLERKKKELKNMIKKRLIELLAGARKYIIYQVIWQWIALLLQITVVFSIADLLERIIYMAVNAENIRNTVVILLLALIFRYICDRMAAKASYNASVDVKRILRTKIYEKLLRLGAAYKETTATSEVVQMSGEGVEQLEIYFGKYLPQLIYSLAAPVTLFVVLSRISVKASVVLLVCVPLIPVSIVVIQKFAKKLLKKYWGIYTGLGDSFLENLQGLTTLKIYQADGKKAEEMNEKAQDFRRVTMKVLTMQLNSTTVMDIIAYGGAAVGMVVAVYEFLNYRISVAGTLSIILLAAEFFIPLRLLGSFFHIAMNGMAASDKIFALLDMDEPKVKTKEVESAELDIRLSNIHFSYEKEREILKDINLTLPSGGFVSLVGESGCGKSTLAGLLSGKNRRYTGEILIGGTSVSEIREADLMKHITLIRHNSYLFKGTVQENLLMAKSEAKAEEMISVLKKMNLWSYLELQQGLDTVLLENAGNLSGGQRQRLALARALLHNTDIYIFDEATSNIDAESELLIMEVIHELSKTKTVLLISHRLANVIASDCIYMMEQGKVIEQGTHHELIQKKGAYQRLYDNQMKLEKYGKAV
jgi:ABC-type transport system involved in cytochrome bd biosynthesis fused ATPase/permease subunit